ncbi:hypothetical protein BJ878DRAFT_515682 [Calycina marina]|uniref:DUF2423 domain-containing protein n=1 Tax=Calycina marina TaxID=1763456 RepID=A0A9P7YZ75_9HELO|nr:hypothetical protein BJ878DRAFT_515682 [Calycina marina]
MLSNIYQQIPYNIRNSVLFTSRLIYYTMAKGARASTIKSNNSKLKSKVFGPIETARTKRLSAKLLALASQPSPKVKEAEGEIDAESDSAQAVKDLNSESKDADAMDVDGAKPAGPSKRSLRVQKQRSSSRKASIVFPRFVAGKKIGGQVKKSKRS